MRFFNAIRQILLTKCSVCDQSEISDGFFALGIVVVDIRSLMYSLTKGNAQRAAKLLSAVFIKLDKGMVTAVVDDLQQTLQNVASYYGYCQHLFCTVAQTSVSYPQKT